MLKKTKTFLTNKGIGLIEVIAALGVATVITTSLVALSIFTLRASLKSKLFLESSKVANKEIELIRAYRDQNIWSNFTTELLANCKSATTPPVPVCYMTDTSGIAVNLNGPNPALATLPVTEVSKGFYVVSDSTSDLIKVNVVVQWREGNLLKSTTLRSDFTNWQGK